MCHDGNGNSHVKTSLLGPYLAFPFIDSELGLGTWLQIVFLELYTRSKNRDLILQGNGE